MPAASDEFACSDCKSRFGRLAEIDVWIGTGETKRLRWDHNWGALFALICERLLKGNMQTTDEQALVAFVRWLDAWQLQRKAQIGYWPYENSRSWSLRLRVSEAFDILEGSKGWGWLKRYDDWRRRDAAARTAARLANSDEEQATATVSGFFLSCEREHLLARLSEAERQTLVMYEDAIAKGTETTELRSRLPGAPSWPTVPQKTAWIPGAGEATATKQDPQNQPLIPHAEPTLPPLTDEDFAILTYLREQHPRLRSLTDVEAGAMVSRKTAGERITKLIAAGLATRPEGERAGVGLTPAGESLLAKLPASL
jgi:DNA-binding MarR family transcriptional regulator